MKSFFRFALVALAMVLCIEKSHAQLEAIGPITIVNGQPIDLFYDNDLAPEPHRKVLQFSGEAINSSGVPALLDMQFDYVDMAGNTQFITLPNSPYTIPAGGAPRLVEGIHILDFCPEVVSLHFTLLEGDAIELTGDFSHVCVTIPEPSTIMIAAMGLTIAMVNTRRPKPRLA